MEQTGGVEQLDCRFSDAVIVLQTDDSCGRVLAYPDGSNEGIQWEIERSFQFLHTVAARSKLGSFVSVFDAKDEFPNIFSETEIGPGARIVEGVVVGNRFAIGANAVVLQEVPADSTAVGVPGHPFQRLTVRR